jgi:CheY-like chemotaxis protein
LKHRQVQICDFFHKRFRLALVHQIVKADFRRVSNSQTLRRGCEFVETKLASKGNRCVLSILQPKEINKARPVWTILVVDDEPAVCDAIKMMLEHDGHKVQTTSSGREALILLEHSKFDLVTTDFSMLEMKGDTLAAAIKQRLPGQPVLMISTNGANAQAAGQPLPGVDLVISKPFLLEELRKAIDTVLPGT